MSTTVLMFNGPNLTRFLRKKVWNEICTWFQQKSSNNNDADVQKWRIFFRWANPNLTQNCHEITWDWRKSSQFSKMLLNRNKGIMRLSKRNEKASIDWIRVIIMTIYLGLGQCQRFVFYQYHILMNGFIITQQKIYFRLQLFNHCASA